MPRPAAEVLTAREAQIMAILWELREASADEVRDRLAGKPHDSTVRTLLRILQSKGYVRVRGRTRYLYRPAVARAAVQRKAVRNFLKRFFGGSAEALVLRLIEDEQLSPEQLDELQRASSAQPCKGRKS